MLTLFSWIKAHGLIVSEDNLSIAIGDGQNRGHRKLNWNETPRQDCATPDGRVNDALTDDGKGFAPKSETNRTFRQLAESNRPKPEARLQCAVHEDYKAMPESVFGRTHARGSAAEALRHDLRGHHH